MVLSNRQKLLNWQKNNKAFISQLDDYKSYNISDIDKANKEEINQIKNNTTYSHKKRSELIKKKKLEHKKEYENRLNQSKESLKKLNKQLKKEFGIKGNVATSKLIEQSLPFRELEYELPEEKYTYRKKLINKKELIKGMRYTHEFEGYRSDSKSHRNPADFEMYFSKIRLTMGQAIREDLKHFSNMRLQYIIKIKMKKSITVEKLLNKKGNDDIPVEFAYEDFYFTTSTITVYNEDDIDNVLEEIYNDILTKIENFIINGSNWTIVRILKSELHIAELTLDRIGSYFPLCQYLIDKKALINPQNEDDNECFKWCWCIHQYLKRANEIENKQDKQKALKDLNRISKYKKNEKLIIDEMMKNYEMPMTLKQVEKFERENSNISINILAYEQSFSVYYKSKNKSKDVMNLLYVSNNDINHFVYIKSLARLLNNGNENQTAYWCMNCFNYFSSQSVLDNHKIECNQFDTCNIKLPIKEEATFSFKKIKNKLQPPFVLYCDFESLLQPIPNTEESRHIPCSFKIYRHCHMNDKLNKSVLYRGKEGEDDIGKIFLETVLNEKREIETLIYNLLKKNKVYDKSIITKEEQHNYESSTICHICEGEILSETNNYKVLDHCHITGKYRGPAHRFCNLNFNYDKALNIPIIFHNFKGYDSHFIISALDKKFKPSVIATSSEKIMTMTLRSKDSWKETTQVKKTVKKTVKKNKEKEIENKELADDEKQEINECDICNEEHENKNINRCNKCRRTRCDTCSKTKEDKKYKQCYECIMKREEEKELTKKEYSLKFIDSMNFLASSLDTLSTNLKDNKNHKYNIIQQQFPNLTIEQFELLLEKGVYPYEYMTSYDKFNETQLPSKDKFYSKLKRETISNEEYERAKRVWKLFNCKTMGDYHDLYLKIDVFLLAEVYESFRSILINETGLDPANYLSIPSFALDEAMKRTKVKLDLFNDEEQDKYMYIERGIRGGQCYVAKRYAKANNKYINGYDKSKPSSYIIALDENNQYGNAMRQCLPEGDFKWVSSNWTTKQIHKLRDEDKRGYIFEVDGYFPKHLHKYLRDLPPMPETYTPELSKLSKYQKDLRNKFDMKNTKFNQKLIGTFLPKKKYVVHYRNLKFYLELGLKITKIHRVLSFKQSKWLLPFVDYYTEKRKNAKNDFEKDLYKLIINSVFGKFLENVRDHIDYQFITDDRVFKKQIRKFNFKTYRNIRPSTEDDFGVVGLSLTKKSITLNKPISVGFTILELSKLSMYKFHYNVMKKRYGDKIHLLYTDTDSFYYEIFTEDVYEDFKEIKDEWLDTSAYPKDHPLYSDKNKKALGYFKDDTNGVPIDEFIGLRAKMYSYTKHQVYRKDKADEINNPVKYSDYLNDLNNNKLVGREIKKAKGIIKSSVELDIKHCHYQQCIYESVKGDKVRHDKIQSKYHQITSNFNTKQGLNPYDDKRYILDNEIDTVPYGFESENL